MTKKEASRDSYEKIEVLFGPDQDNYLIQTLYRLAMHYNSIITEEIMTQMMIQLFNLNLINSDGEVLEDVGKAVRSYVKPQGYKEPYELDAFKANPTQALQATDSSDLL